ncbi:MFS general substrate transporter [Epithele typhae]|uniref:MFS general substrate transporter n=1 Tax=Epithele typhae TaxID=378194 RepID=UPI00200766FA|nr:MFS general substrate transporter [Epithele typhae]KAH9942152.1 MFS general substrate transporter [Epithele typhae]
MASRRYSEHLRQTTLRPTSISRWLTSSTALPAQIVKAHGDDETAEDAQPPQAQPPLPPLPLKAHFMYGTLLWTMFLSGWNDGTPGPLIPRIQEVYHIGFIVVSLIFVFNFLGFVTAAALNVWLTDKYGLGKVMVVGAVCQIVGYCLAAPAPPFPVFVLAHLFNGLGISLQLSGSNSFVSSYRQNVSTRLALLHSIYGAGALAAPLVATQFSQMTHWSFHYLISLAMAVVNITLLAAVFRLKTHDECLREIGITPATDGATDEVTTSKYKQMMKLPIVHQLALFILIYVGTEVTLGGWIVTYVIDLRGGGPSSGYISSGFFGGLMAGRILLLGVNKLRSVMRAYRLELVVWLVPSLVGGAVAVAFVGMLLGPMYPLVVNHARQVLPPWLLSGSIGWIAGFGQAGSAFLPFVTGALASKVGIKVLQPVIVSMMGVMVTVWVFVPHAPRRLE